MRMSDDSDVHGRSSGAARPRKAIDNFPVSGEPIPAPVARWLGRIKAAAARVNAELGLLDAGEGGADRRRRRPDRGRRARRPVPDRRLPDRLGHLVEHERERGDRDARRRGRARERRREHGPVVERRLPVGRAPGGARRARQRPAAGARRSSSASLAAKAVEFDDVVKSGRTHWMDAVPVTLGQEFGGYAAQVREGQARVEATLERLGKIPLGGTAVGTGPQHAPRVRRARAREARRRHRPDDQRRPPIRSSAQAARDGLVEASGALKIVAVSLTKIANDLRFLGSGPRAGLVEIFLPELQKGSSIMPGKVNPVIPEVVTQVAAQVIGNDAAIAIGGMQGHFELNVFIPLMARNLLDSIRLLASASRLLAEKCVDGIEANREQCEQLRRADALGGDRAQPVHRLRQGERDRQGGVEVGPVAARGRARGRRRGRACSTRRSTSARWRSRTADGLARDADLRRAVHGRRSRPGTRRSRPPSGCRARRASRIATVSVPDPDHVAA